MIKPTHYQSCDATEDIGRNPSEHPTIGEVVATRLNRRHLLQGAFGLVALAATRSGVPTTAAASLDQSGASRFDFAEVATGSDRNHAVASGYNAEILIRWGDPVAEGAPPFDPAAVTPQSQRLQFGYNNDFLGYLPMPGAADPSRHGLLVVNHEFTNTELMLPDYVGREQAREVIDLEIAAHGGSVVEIQRRGGDWRVVERSKYARRIDAMTPMDLTGPAAGHARMQTAADLTGQRVLGMINNCGGGLTPWGTWLSCEENFHGYFSGEAGADAEIRNFSRYGIPGHWFFLGPMVRSV